MRYLSPYMCHLSCVTCHMSPVTCHLSNVFFVVNFVRIKINLQSNGASWWRVCCQLGIPPDMENVGILGSRIPFFYLPPPTKQDLKGHYNRSCWLKLELDGYKQPPTPTHHQTWNPKGIQTFSMSAPSSFKGLEEKN